MAITYVTTAPIIHCTAQGDTIPGPIRLRGLKIFSTTTYTVRITSGGVDNIIFAESQDKSSSQIDYFLPPLVLNEGITVSTLTPGAEILFYI